MFRIEKRLSSYFRKNSLRSADFKKWTLHKTYDSLYAYAVRHNLPEYHIYLDAVALELRLRGLDVERMLTGLPYYSIDRYP
jgi:hypothetical protein